MRLVIWDAIAPIMTSPQCMTVAENKSDFALPKDTQYIQHYLLKIFMDCDYDRSLGKNLSAKTKNNNRKLCLKMQCLLIWNPIQKLADAKTSAITAKLFVESFYLKAL